MQLLPILLVLAPLSSSAPEPLSLDALFGLLADKHPLFTKETLKSDGERAAQRSHLGTQDWNLQARPTIAYSEPDASNPFAGDKAGTLGFEASAERVLWSTGGRFRANISSNYTHQRFAEIAESDTQLPPGTPDPSTLLPPGLENFVQLGVGVSYSHPLMQNLGGTLDRLPFELSGFNIARVELEAAENKEALLLDIGLRYLDWVFLNEQQKLMKARLKLAQRSLRLVLKRHKANLVDKVDVLRADDSVQIAKQSLVWTKARSKAKQSELAVLTQEPKIYNQAPSYPLYEVHDLPDADSAITSLKESSRLVQTLNTVRSQLERQHAGIEETLEPQLFVTVGAGVTHDIAGYVDDTSENDLRPDVYALLNFQYPLGNTTAEADADGTRLKIMQVQEEVKEVELSLEATARSLLIQLKDLQEVLRLNELQIKSAQRKTQEESKLYKRGRSMLTFVLQSQDGEQSAKLARAETAATYQKLFLQYQALTDALLKQHQSTPAPPQEEP